ncbi:MAG: PIG-L deacetylase family protein [Nanobdellota archaeon]
MDAKDVILVVCAHNDDHILGVGGTLAKYAKQGYKVVVIILSYGETSHVWLKQKEIIKTRVKESRNADKILGLHKTYYYGLKEGSFLNEFENKGIQKKLLRTISVLKPVKIFTHSFDDLHPDHRATYSKLMETVEKSGIGCDVYSFDIWNPFNIRKRDSPKMVVDITKTFKLKVKSFALHKSQWQAKLIMTPAMYARGILNGLEHGIKFAEVFYKLK